jgi:hypothetical protein
MKQVSKCDSEGEGEGDKRPREAVGDVHTHTAVQGCQRVFRAAGEGREGERSLVEGRLPLSLNVSLSRCLNEPSTVHVCVFMCVCMYI